MHPALAAAGAGAIAIPIAIHLLSRAQRKPVAWGAMRFLIDAFKKHKKRLRMEQWLLLALRCLIMLLIGLALADPIRQAAAGGFGLQGRGRMVVLVIDDSLSSQVENLGEAGAADGSRSSGSDARLRFAQLKAKAVQLLSTLKPEDRVALWLAGDPVRPIIASGTLDHGQARQAIEQLTPRFGGSAVVPALSQLSQQIDAERPDVDRVFVAILSDWSQDAIDFERAEPGRLESLAQQATLLVNPPTVDVPNVQVAQLSLGRSVVLASGDQPINVPVSVTLRRFASAAAGVGNVNLRLWLPGDEQPLASLDRQANWATGQSQLQLSATLVVDRTTLSRVFGSGWRSTGGHRVLLEARTEPDSLEADNRRWAVLELRPRLAVGLVDTDMALGMAQDQLTPRRWVSLALSPRADEMSPSMELIETPASLLPEQAPTLQAAIVLRPDLLNEDGWTALAELAQRGGLVWITAPVESSSTGWATTMAETLELPWRFGMEPIVAGQNDGQGAGNAPAPGWSLAASNDTTATPEALELLGPDWVALLRPIRLYKRVPVTAEQGDANVWLRTADGQPVMMVLSLGDGQVVVLATAIDTDWTNLPTKPLFLPLMHETLRGLIGQSGDAARLSEITVGQSPTLPARWAEAQTLNDPQGVPIRLQRLESGELITTDPLMRPGVYEASPGQPRRLAVNIDPDAGDTRSLNRERLAEWFDQLGEWRWLEDNVAQTLSAQVQSASFGWPLLWIVLVLVILETVLARRFSHAKTETHGHPILSRIRAFFQESA